jgi:chloramphenicol-sensitive protein RarD
VPRNASSVTSPASTTVGTGLALAISSYALWGFLPLFFIFLVPSGALEIVAWRIVLSLVFCLFLLTVLKGWPALMVIVRDTRTMLILGAAGVFILINWLVYVFAAVSGHVVEASLGYFTNPIITVVLGVVLLRERLRPLQWTAIAISAGAVLVLAVNYGQFPWIALALATSFGFYGFIKKSVGSRVDAVGGLTIETAWLAPLAIAQLVVLGVTGTLTMGTVSPIHTFLLLSCGAVTAIPLLLFAAASRRLPLAYMGLTQYVAPVLQFLVGVFVLNEDMPPARWMGFALVWVALILLTFDMFAAGRKSRRASLLLAPGDGSVRETTFEDAMTIDSVEVAEQVATSPDNTAGSNKV